MAELKTKRLLAIRPAEDTQYQRDGVVGGLGVRWGARGVPSFTLVYRVKGQRRQRQVKLGIFWRGEGDSPDEGYLTLAQARARAAQIKEAAARGIDASKAPKRAAPGVTTVAALAERFFADRASRLRSAEETERALRRNVIAQLGERPIREVTRAELREIFAQIKDRGAGAMANRTFSVARTFFTWAVDNDYLDASPLAGMKRPFAGESSRDRVLTDEELGKVWRGLEALHPPRRDCIRMLILCGTRLSETTAMCWGNLHLERREWTIPASIAKNKTEHVVYLPDLAIAVIEAQPRFADCPYVFTYDGVNPVGSLSTYFATLARALKLEVRLHDLRRTFASGLQRLGVDPVVIDRCLAHSSVVRGIAAIYLRHRYADERRAAMERWGAHVAKLLNFR